MNGIELRGFDQNLPKDLNISVVMEKRGSDHLWADYSYRAIGVLVAESGAEKETRSIFRKDGVEHFLVTGLILQLHEDQCESYYHNLMSPKPGCYIVAGEMDDPGTMPIPYLVSMSFDEVHAYLEGDETVYAVEIPAMLYQWVEAFILTHYAPLPKTKRRLKNWKQAPSQQSPGDPSS